MKNNQETAAGNAQFVLSYELLYLLRWLVENDAEKFRKMINKALISGLHKEIQQMRTQKTEKIMHEMQYSILDFFHMLEALIAQSLHDQTVHTALVKNLMPSIEQIDSTICNDTIICSSLEKVTAKIENNSQEDPKDLLFKELLKRWKPHNKNILN